MNSPAAASAVRFCAGRGLSPDLPKLAAFIAKLQDLQKRCRACLERARPRGAVVLFESLFALPSRSLLPRGKRGCCRCSRVDFCVFEIAQCGPGPMKALDQTDHMSL